MVQGIRHLGTMRAHCSKIQRPLHRQRSMLRATRAVCSGTAVVSRHQGRRNATTAAARYPDEIMPAPAPVQVQTSKDSEFSVRLVINVPAQRCDEAYNRVLSELRKDYNVPGFQNKDKIPTDMIVQAAGGERQVKFACLEQVMHSTIEEAFSHCNEKVIDGTVKVESDAEALVDQFRRDADLQYVVTAETGDLGVSFSGPYTGWNLEVEAVLNQSKEDLMVEQSVQRFLRDRGGSLQVANRGAQMGDSLIIDFEVRNKETQETIPAMSQQKHELDCLSEENFLPGVMKQMMGMQVGEVDNFTFQFPDPWEPIELAGVEAIVKIKVREVLQWKLPPLTLEMCQTLQPDVTSTDEFIKELREAVRLQAEEELQQRIQSKILEKLSEVTTMDRIPPAPFEQFAMGRYEGRLHEALENGVIKQEQLEELTQEEVVKNYINSQRELLEKEFCVLMAVDEIYKREGLAVDEDKVNELLKPQREEFKKMGKIATADQVKEYIRSELQQRATIDFIRDSSSVSIQPLENEVDYSSLSLS